MTSTETTVSFDKAASPLDALSEKSGLSKSRIKEAMTKGAVWIKRGNKIQRLRRAKAVANPGDEVTLYFDADVLNTEAPEPALISDHKDFSVWYKPPGLPSSGSRFGDHTAINRIVEKNWQRPVFLVHRLDQFASGLMVLAHSKRIAAELSRQFQARNVTKRYRAIVIGRLETSQTIDTALDGKDAVSHVTPIEVTDDVTLVEVLIETGRKHQIRRHLAGIGHGVRGDRLYAQNEDGSLALAACELEFLSPLDGEVLSFDLPEEWRPSLTATPASLP